MGIQKFKQKLQFLFKFLVIVLSFCFTTENKRRATAKVFVLLFEKAYLHNLYIICFFYSIYFWDFLLITF